MEKCQDPVKNSHLQEFHTGVINKEQKGKGIISCGGVRTKMKVY